MASVQPKDVRRIIHVSENEVPDDVVQDMIRRASLIVGLELGRNIDHTDCTEIEKEAVTLLAAIYMICYLTGGEAVGLSFRLGDLNISALEKAPSLEILKAELERILSGLKEPYVGVV